MKGLCHKCFSTDVIVSSKRGNIICEECEDE
jgi:transcription initiation factor TFIIIB Brf1 subunit/transcription initiation factor TFIIB